MERPVFFVVLALVLLGSSTLTAEATDSSPDTSQVPRISLQEAIARALKWHPRDRVISAEVKIAIARFEEARAESLPTLALRYEHIWEDSHIYKNGVRDPLDLDNVMAISSVPIIDPRAWANWSEAKERVEASEADALMHRRKIGLAAARAWIGVASAAHALDVEHEALRTARAHAEFVRGRLSGGAAAVLDLVRADREIAVTSAQVERAKATLQRAQELLGLLAGAESALDADVQQDDPLPHPFSERDLTVPDVAAARLALKVARSEVHNMYTAYLPSLDLELLGFFQNHPQPMLPVTGIGYAAFLRLTLPIYQPRRRALLHELRAERLRAEAQLEDVTRTIAVERRDGESDVVHLRTALDETIRAADLARRALELTETRYANGAGTQLDVIYALRESRDADIAVMAGEDALRRAALDLLAARGRLPTYEQLHVQHH